MAKTTPPGLCEWEASVLVYAWQNLYVGGMEAGTYNPPPDASPELDAEVNAFAGLGSFSLRNKRMLVKDLCFKTRQSHNQAPLMNLAWAIDDAKS